MSHSSLTVAPSNPWNNPASMGFSIWKRHTSPSATADLLLLLKKKPGALDGLYRRNLSFTAGLITRQIKRTGGDSATMNLVFRLDRDTGVKYARTASHNLGSAGYGALNGNPSSKTGWHHGANTLLRSFMSADADSNHSLFPERIVTADKDFSRRSSFVETNSGGPGSSASAIGMVKPELTKGHGPRVMHVSPQKNEYTTHGVSVDSIKRDLLESTPLKHIFRNTALSENREVMGISRKSSTTEIHAHSKNLGIRQELVHTDSFPLETRKGLAPGFSFSSMGHLIHPLAQRKSVSVHRHSAGLEREQPLPMRMGSMQATWKSQGARADSARDIPSKPASLPVNDQTFFKAIRRTLRNERLEAGFEQWENSGYAKSGELSAIRVGTGIAQTAKSNGAQRDAGAIPYLLTRSTKLPGAITATAEPAAEPGAHLIIRNVQSDPDMAEARNALPGMAMSQPPVMQPVSIQRLPLPQRSNGIFDRMLLQHPIQRSPRRHLPIWQTLPVAPTIDTYGPAFQMHRYYSSPVSCKISAKGADDLTTSHPTAAADPAAAVHADPLIMRHDSAPEFFINSSQLTSGMGDIQRRATQRSPIGLGSVGAHHAILSTPGSPRMMRLSSAKIAADKNLSLAQMHHNITFPISLEANTINSHKRGILPISDGTGLRLDRFTGHTDGVFNAAALPLTIRRWNRFEDSHIAGTAAGSALHAITRFTQNAAEMPPALLRLNRNLTSYLLPLSRVMPVGESSWLSSRSSSSQGNPAPSTAQANISDTQYDTNFSHESASPFSKWTRGSSNRPLVNIQRAPAQIMRVPIERAGDVIYRELPEDRHGLVSPSNDASHQLSAAVSRDTSSAVTSSTESDPEESAEHVWRTMAERLVIEQERRGLARWP